MASEFPSCFFGGVCRGPPTDFENKLEMRRDMMRLLRLLAIAAARLRSRTIFERVLYRVRDVDVRPKIHATVQGVIHGKNEVTEAIHA